METLKNATLFDLFYNPVLRSLFCQDSINILYETLKEAKKEHYCSVLSKLYKSLVTRQYSTFELILSSRKELYEEIETILKNEPIQYTIKKVDMNPLIEIVTEYRVQIFYEPEKTINLI